MSKILDTNHDVTHKLDQLKAVGIETVIRYIGASAGSEKYIKPAEARAIGEAGLKLGLVFEIWGGEGDFEHGDINAASGAAHGAFARDYVASLGAPSGAVVYFALDTDVSDAQVRSIVLPYLTAVKAALAGSFQMGVYGCGAVCSAALDAGLAVKAWLSNAMGWNGSRAFRASGRETLLQHLPTMIAGLDTDPDDEIHDGDAIGDFIPFSTAAPPKSTTPVPVLHNVRWMQDVLQHSGFYQGEIDGDVGPATIRAMIAYLESVNAT
jgi:Domain of unknown function (DUF1906)